MSDIRAPIRVVAFPLHDWRKSTSEGFRTRDGHLLRAFERSPLVERILVIDRPVSLIERVLQRSPMIASGPTVSASRRGRTRGVVTAVSGKVFVLDMTVPDVVGPARDGRRWWFDIFEREEVKECVEWAVGECIGHDRRVVAWLPTVAPALIRLQPRRFVYDSLDNWLIHPALRRQAARARQAYQRLLPSADSLFVSAPASAKALAEWRTDAVVLPNGVDPEEYGGRFDRPHDLPPGPVVGYAGKLSQRIDSELIVQTASRLPWVQFVLIGPVLERWAVRTLRSASNVALLGDRPYSMMPAYLAHFDIAWIPHRVGAGESGGDPIKLYEYWAAGRQVISTRIDGIEHWQAQIHFIRDAGDAAAIIQGLLEGDLPPKPVAVPRERTWDAIAEVLISALREPGHDQWRR